MKRAPLIIAGCARSGLSLTMQMLEAGGFPVFGTWPAYEDYQLGEIPWGRCRGKAVKVVDTHRQWPPPDNHRVIVLRRNLAFQALSTVQFMSLMGWPATSTTDKRRLRKSIAQDRKQIEQWAARQVAWMLLDFEQLIQQPLQSAREIEHFLKTDLNLDAMARQVRPRGPEPQGCRIELELLEKEEG